MTKPTKEKTAKRILKNSKASPKNKAAAMGAVKKKGNRFI